MTTNKRIAVIGGGWAGMAAAVELAFTTPHKVTVYEAAAQWGGRARGLALQLPNGETCTADNGQHILIGAYTACRTLMERVGIHAEAAFTQVPLSLRYPDGSGIRFPDWPTPWDALWGIASARGWSLAERAQLLARATRWRLQGFGCAPRATVADLCAGLPQRLLTEFFDPLCISALNTPIDQASGRVFLRVLQDSLFAIRKGSQFWLPQIDLGNLFPGTAVQWLAARGHSGYTSRRVQHISAAPQGGWLVQGIPFDAVVLAASPWEAARLVADAQIPAADWLQATCALEHTAIATVYAWNPATPPSGHSLPAPLLALRNTAEHPAQFVFDRGQLGGPAGLLAFVISTSVGGRAQIEQQVIAQAQAQLGLALQPLQTVVEKRATFACTPGLVRPDMQVAPALVACGDYIDGPYPATLEGAVRSGVAAARALAYL
ncbi:hydroxysqualene dehydroxylase HpnE [Comamonas sp. 4034]|uniref:hydroxysqualene dehydroxylase HpnE n=1 Tax=Comamonas sp. 4034 TaxID=3156455 RepID=UPI003D1DD3E4